MIRTREVSDGGDSIYDECSCHYSPDFYFVVDLEAQPDFKELLELLNARKVEYVIVGGYAVAFHGAPRYTGDIDLYIKVP